MKEIKVKGIFFYLKHAIIVLLGEFKKSISNIEEYKPELRIKHTEYPTQDWEDLSFMDKFKIQVEEYKKNQIKPSCIAINQNL